MKNIFIISIASLRIVFFGTGQAGWLDSEDTKKNDMANIIVNECISIIQDKANKDTGVKLEVYPGDIKILSDHVILLNIILLGYVDNYVSKQEKEGVCKYIPKSNSISWQPILQIQ